MKLKRRGVEARVTLARTSSIHRFAGIKDHACGETMALKCYSKRHFVLPDHARKIRTQNESVPAFVTI